MHHSRRKPQAVKKASQIRQRHQTVRHRQVLYQNKLLDITKKVCYNVECVKNNVLAVLICSAQPLDHKEVQLDDY